MTAYLRLLDESKLLELLETASNQLTSGDIAFSSEGLSINFRAHPNATPKEVMEDVTAELQYRWPERYGWPSNSGTAYFV